MFPVRYFSTLCWQQTFRKTKQHPVHTSPTYVVLTSKTRMDSLPPQSWTTADLRTFLKTRAITYSGYSKAGLVCMVEKAIANPGITEVTQASDQETAATSRRTISVSGNLLLFPDPLAITAWDANLTSLPHLTSTKCLVYLLSKGGWSSEQAISYEKERGYQLFLEKHIEKVELRQEDHNMTYVRALCRRQTTQSENPYQVWLFGIWRSGPSFDFGCSTSFDFLSI